MSFAEFGPYVPMAARRARAAREVRKLMKKRTITPVVIKGRKIAQSFWGNAWCDNLERYSDFASRLPRGRTYVRNGSVIDLQIERGRLCALVSGSEVYQVEIDITVAAPSRWKAICGDCVGSVGSLVELLQGKLSKNVMERVCRESDGLFPAPSEIKMSCSCPDFADMCKHVAAVLYGTGARLDAAPDLLFSLRGVNREELISAAGTDPRMTMPGAASERVLVNVDVAALFGLDIAPPSDPPVTKHAKTAPSGGRETRKPATGAARRASRPDTTVADDRGERKNLAARGETTAPGKTAAAKKKTPKVTPSPGKVSETSQVTVSTASRRAGGAGVGRKKAPKTTGSEPAMRAG
jgi:uncharacterized Zn finger protein